jgi:hypothetical protein
MGVGPASLFRLYLFFGFFFLLLFSMRENLQAFIYTKISKIPSGTPKNYLSATV